MCETTKTIKNPTLLLILEINERVETGNTFLREGNAKNIQKSDIDVLAIDKESLIKIEKEFKDFGDPSIPIWANNLHKKIELNRIK